MDEIFNVFAWYTGNIMMSSGNMKKGMDALKIKKGLYKSLEEIEEEKAKKANPKKNVQEEREKLIKRFNLDESMLKTK